MKHFYLVKEFKTQKIFYLKQIKSVQNDKLTFNLALLLVQSLFTSTASLQALLFCKSVSLSNSSSN